MMHALIVEDHGMMRAGLQAVLAHAFNADISEACYGNVALQLIRACEFDLVLLDLGLPDISGFDVLRQARRLQPKLPILIVSMLPEEKHAGRLLKAGASGYIMKDCDTDDFVKAVQQILHGRRYISPQLAEQLFLQSEAGASRLPHMRLTEREYAIFELIVDGMALIDIAAHLHISEKTVSTHRARILQKMDMTSNAALIKYALTNGLI